MNERTRERRQGCARLRTRISRKGVARAALRPQAGEPLTVILRTPRYQGQQRTAGGGRAVPAVPSVLPRPPCDLLTPITRPLPSRLFRLEP